MRTKQSINMSYYHYKLTQYDNNNLMVSSKMYKTQREILSDIGISRSGCHRLLCNKALEKHKYYKMEKCHIPVFKQIKVEY
jgi:DNA-directed RNA polymerase subunit N (RpoN/RPB10)